MKSLVIWNKIESDKIDIVITDIIEIFVNGVSIWSMKVEDSGDYDTYHELLDDIEKINIAYIKKDTEQYQKLSEEFLQKLKTM
jgi:hypothetical protein